MKDFISDIKTMLVRDYYHGIETTDYNLKLNHFELFGKGSLAHSILENIKIVFASEKISEKDIIVINKVARSFDYEGIGSYHPKLFNRFEVQHNLKKYTFIKKADCKKIEGFFVDVFILSEKYFIKISIGERGIIERVEHIIQRDIKKLNIADNNLLEIYFHGHFDPETLVLDDYKSAAQIQRHLTDLRQIRFSNHNKRVKK